MITNSGLTIYHKRLDNSTKIEKWTRTSYQKVWWFGGRGSYRNKGYEDANDVDVRIPLDENAVDLTYVGIGDIMVKGIIDKDIQKQQDLKGYEVYNILTINNNNFGNTPHIRLGGK